MDTHLQSLLRRAIGACILASTLLPSAAQAETFVPDQGFYRVYQGDRMLGIERISFEQHGDSLVMISKIDERLPREGGQQDTLTKVAMQVFAMRDRSWRGYQSYEQVNSAKMTRILNVADTTYTSYRQSDEGGFGDTYVRPPGRVYVVDPQVFALFDALCRDMHAQHFTERAISMIYVTGRDTTVRGMVKRMGTVPFKIGKETIIAEQFKITDPWSEFLAWVSPNGRMLKLALPAIGLRVERDPESLKPGRPFVPMGSIGPGIPTLDAASASPIPAVAPTIPPPSTTPGR